MEREFRIEAHESGDLIGDNFRRMVVAVVHQRHHAFVRSREAEREFCGTDCVGFNADTEHLGFYAGLDHCGIVRFGKDLLDRIFVTHSGSHAVSGDIFEAVAGPDVHDAGDTGLFSKIVGNADTGFSVFDPEFSGLGIGAGEGKTVLYFRVREERGVEVDTGVVFFSQIHPLFEVLRLDLIAVNIFAFFEDGVAGMYV